MNISQDRLRELFDFNFELGVLLWRFRPEIPEHINRRLAGTEAGTIHKNYRYVKVDQKKYAVHRVIWKLAYGNIPDDMQIDHIDGDGLNNKLDNLRLVTNQQNQLNRKVNKGRKYKGVYKSRDKFKAEIMTEEGRLYIGVYGTPEDAARAYNEAAKEHHGEYARLNEIKFDVCEVKNGQVGATEEVL